MPPQPIDKVKRGAKYRLFFDSAEELGPVSHAITTCIAKWAGVELTLGYLFVFLFHANEEQGAELYASLDSATAKFAAMRSLAIATFEPEEYELLSALLRYTKSQQKIRDKLAHWIIGSSAEIPDAAIIVDPKSLWGTVGTSKKDYREAEKDGRPAVSKLVPREKVFVYRRDDIAADTRSFVELSTLILKFTVLVSAIPKSQQRRKICGELSRDARLQQA